MIQELIRCAVSPALQRMSGLTKFTLWSGLSVGYITVFNYTVDDDSQIYVIEMFSYEKCCGIIFF